MSEPAIQEYCFHCGVVQPIRHHRGAGVDWWKLEQVRRRKKPTKFFWCDMTDIFGEWMKPEWLKACFDTMDATPQHVHMLLTKRPENIRRMWPREQCCDCHGAELRGIACGPCGDTGQRLYDRPNVWLITSLAEQQDADRNIPLLLKCRDLVPVLGLSCEPLIGPIDLTQVQYDGMVEINSLNGDHGVHRPLNGRSESRIDWVIVGCESGPHRRPMKLEWAQSLVDQCRAANVAVFVKQIEVNGKVTGDIDQFPEPLRIREFPAGENG